MPTGRRTFLTALVAIVAIACLVVGFARPVLRAIVAAGIDVVTGDRVTFTDLDLRRDGASARNVTVARAGAQVFAAARVDVRYDLRDLLPGARRRYGLERVVLLSPRITLTRRADGSFEVAPFAMGPAPAGRGRTATLPGVPLRFAGIVHDGTIVVDDRFRVLPESRRIALAHLDGTLAYDDAGLTAYRLHGDTSADGSGRITLGGRIDLQRGYAQHRLQARALDVVPVVNYFINTPDARFERGTARDVDVRAYGFAAGSARALRYHVVGSFVLARGSMRVPGLVPNATELGGRVDVYDGGFAAPRLTARLGGLGARLAGGLYDWTDLKFRLGIAFPDASLARIRSLFAFSRDLPIRGGVRLATLLEGPVGSPLVATHVEAPALSYAGFPLEAAVGRAIYYNGAVDVVGATARYGGLDLRADGAVALDVPRTRLVVDVAGPAAGVPYLAEVAPGARFDASGIVTGAGLALETRGALEGAGGGVALGGLFHQDARGDGSYGPFRLDRLGGASLAGAFTFQRSTGTSAFWLDASRFPYAASSRPARLPGIDVAAPTFSGELDGSLAGIGPPSDFRIAGDIRARDVRAGGVDIATVHGHVAGRIGEFGLQDVTASGRWGSFSGAGAYVGSGLALTGTYHGSFDRLRTFTGNLGGQGPVDGPVALALDPRRTVVQVRRARTPGASIRGVAVDELSGTLAVTGKRVDVYAASGSVANGSFVAAGNLEGPATLGVSLADADASRLRSIAPLGGGGRLAAIGTFGQRGANARFVGGVVLGGGTTFDRLPLWANGDVTLDGTTLGFSQTDAQLGEALGSLDGRVANVGTTTATVDARLQLAAARIGPLLRRTLPQRGDVAGTLTGDLRVRGSGADLGVSGTIGIAEGEVNGLAFHDARAQIAVAPGELVARRGTVTVGSTRTSFGADVRGNDAALHVEAPHADLGDFNDYFDAGDTLGGRGRIAAQFVRHGGSVRTSADVAIDGLHVRRFDLGDATARWTSRGRDVAGSVAFGGASGRLETTGVLGLPPSAPLDRLLERSRFTGTARLRGLDLGVWLPALGYQVPVSGRVDADASIAGPLRNPDVRTEATLVGGSLGRFPVERLTLAATSTLRGTTVSRADLELPGLSLVGSGRFGLGEADPIRLAVHAKSPDVGSIAARLFGALPVSGAAEVDVKIDGTRGKPRVAGGFDLERGAVRGVAVPRALGQFSLNGRDLVLTSVEVGFATGTLALAGSVPLQVAPLGLGPARSPISLEIAASGIDLGNFASLLPAGSKLGGKVDGRVVVGGTAGAPRLDGGLALANGALSSPLETVPLTGIAASLAFAGTDARLERLHAEAGGGSIDATGGLSLRDLVRPTQASAYRFGAVAKRLRLNLPAYGDGQVDGTLAISHVPGSRPKLTGDLALRDATIPFAALLVGDGGTDGGALGAAPAPPPNARASDLALDLGVRATSDVRVRSSNVDIGARGELHVGGTTSAPALDGGFDSTGGTLTYFNTVFRLVDGRVSFDPTTGLVPTLDARAVTHVLDPDPNTVRNVAGSADVTLGLSGPVTNLTIALSSDPVYDRSQILGLLLSAPALGASNLFGDAGTPTPYGSATYAGASAGLPTRGTGQFSVAQEAFGIANAQFTRTLLAPIETKLARAVGLSNFNVNVDYTGNVGLTARKVLGRKLNAVYGTSFGYPYRQTFGFEIKPSDATAAQVTVFQTLGSTGLTSLAPPPYGTTNNLKLQAAQPSGGTVGFSLSLQRLFR
ncbi:MAG: hypothetical protein NVSMB59_00760 [Vulcanimicrobiaceae bacterium]